MAESFADLLKCPLKETDKTIGCLGSATTKVKYLTSIKIRSRYCSETITLEALILDIITGIQPPQRFDIAEFNIPSNFELADPQFNVPQKIDLLLGNKYVFQLLSLGKIFRGPLVLQNSLFGWIAAGSYFTTDSSIAPQREKSFKPRSTVVLSSKI